MAASIGSYFENIKSQYLKKEESDFHEVWIQMCSFPNTIWQNPLVILCSFPFKTTRDLVPWEFVYIYIVFLCFEGNVINMTISHIKLPPRNAPRPPPQLFTSPYV